LSSLIEAKPRLEDVRAGRRAAFVVADLRLVLDLPELAFDFRLVALLLDFGDLVSRFSLRILRGGIRLLPVNC